MPVRDEREGGYDGTMERRVLGPRFAIAARVSFWWQSTVGPMRQATGISRDISACGISIISSAIPIPGDQIEVMVELPRGVASTSALHGRGVVLRLQPQTGQPWGFAVSVNFEQDIDSANSEKVSGPTRASTYRGSADALSLVTLFRSINWAWEMRGY